MNGKLTLVSMGCHTRLGDVLEYALHELPFDMVTIDELPEVSLRGRRLCFALSVDESGVQPDYFRALGYLRAHTGALEDSVGVLLVDGASEQYTKGLARTLVLAANASGCRFPGRPLVEATKSLKNFEVLSGVRGIDRFTAYRHTAKSLLSRLAAYVSPRFEQPQVLLLHASNPERSNTLALGRAVAKRLGPSIDTRELTLAHDAIYDCHGCGYTACVHYAEQESCFYGGLLPESVFPAIQACNALLLLCPNYNDAPSAHFAALLNRLNALLLRGESLEKDIYAIVVSGYSGSDIVAEQILGGFCLNKGFSLPPRFALLETANDPGEALALPGVAARLDAFSNGILQSLLKPAD